MRKLLVLAILSSMMFVAVFGGIIDEIKSRGYLVVGTEATFPPFEYYNENNEIVGFDIDIARKIAEALGVELKVVDTAFDGLIPSLLTKKLDMVIAGMTITEERAKVVAFSEPYFTAGQVIVVRKGSTPIKDFEGLKGKVVAVQLGTTGDLVVSELKGIKEVRRFEKFTDAFLELKNRRVDAVVLDSAVAKAYVLSNPNLEITSDVLSSEQYGIAVRKEDKDLLEFINKVLADMRKSPYDLLIEKWFAE
ncbi:MAG: arginine/lysine/histidine transporter system substrate-binding protein [Thermotogaceae bacterium]|jgi:polar amino acid transport system substrate-binding protein|nr:arginine/lysine/histidine transporter system substrate-binding protein [Thermotogaceae bacterium]